MEEECFYCEKISEYNDLVKDDEHYIITGVCRKHATKYGEAT
jgi:hypothetical protein